MNIKNVVSQMRIALAGNPNVGKSTVFNNLTGMNQHTGNWPGKTVSYAEGNVKGSSCNIKLIDLPGTYSLLAHSAEEEVARDYICFGQPDAVIIVCDAVCIERNLNLVLQTLEITNKAVVCVNLMDEAKKKSINLNLNLMQKILGVPVIGTSARSGKGLRELISTVENISASDVFRITYPEEITQAAKIVSDNLYNTPSKTWIAYRLLEDDKAIWERINREYHDVKKIEDSVKAAKEYLASCGVNADDMRDIITHHISKAAHEITEKTVKIENVNKLNRDRKIDKIILGKYTGIPIMLLLLAVIFWITIYAANYPSSLLMRAFTSGGDYLRSLLVSINSPVWLTGVLIDGMYSTLTWVVSVMLPPMAIFFPLFTILEDLGYLPRIAFTLDKAFYKAKACGKQALCMCMGFGCNAAGVTGCRIIDSPRERLVAILTNSFVPCNGRFAPPHKEKQKCCWVLTIKKTQ